MAFFIDTGIKQVTLCGHFAYTLRALRLNRCSTFRKAILILVQLLFNRRGRKVPQRKTTSTMKVSFRLKAFNQSGIYLHIDLSEPVFSTIN